MFWRLIAETSDRVVIVMINIVIAKMVFPIQSSPSGDGFYACELSKICSMVIRKNITLVACYKILYFESEKGLYQVCFSAGI